MNLSEAITAVGLSGAVSGLSAAVENSEALISRMRSALQGYDDDGAMDVVACGSLARREYTLASDVDYLVIVNAMPKQGVGKVDHAVSRSSIGRLVDRP